MTEAHKKFSRTKATLSTELFKDQKIVIPDCIKGHPIFTQPNRIRKVFPSIGLKNFKKEAAMAMPALDLKRGDNFVSLLIKVMHKGLCDANKVLEEKIDMAQFGYGEFDEKQLDDISTTKVIVEAAARQLNLNIGVIEKVVQSVSGKIALKLFQDIVGTNGKVIHKKDVAFFSLFAKFKEKFREWNFPFLDLEATREFKIFNTENIPNKKYLVCFSSDGKEGAWDILTMSMRGIKSCQTWESQYPRCLIGSVISKYVGIIYLTSGADYEGFGSKMIRRSIVRYVIDAVDRKPCLLVDKMYMEEHPETIKLFIETLAEASGLPVYYSPHLKNKVRHLYVPNEPLRNKVAEKEWSYQDIALKTNMDIKIHTLSSGNLEEYNRRVSTFQGKLISGLSDEMRAIYDIGRAANPILIRMVCSVRMEQGYDRVSQLIINDVVVNNIIDVDMTAIGVKAQYKRFLMKFIGKKKEVRQFIIARLAGYFIEFQIDSTNKTIIADMICDSIQKTLKQELKLTFSL